jgi:hypothetical protein
MRILSAGLESSHDRASARENYRHHADRLDRRVLGRLDSVGYETHFTRLAGNSQVEPIVLNRRFSWKFRAISALNWSTAGDKEIQIRGIFVGCRRITAERGWPFVSSGSATLDVPN